MVRFGPKKPQQPVPLRYMPAAISRLLGRIPKAGPSLVAFYRRVQNPVNYAIVGGLGVLINMVVSGVLWIYVGGWPWWLINAIAIVAAWVWNWSQSVGPLGWIWGFKPRK